MNSLTLSSEARDLVKRDCLSRTPLEACGFIVGPKGTSAGVRVVPMRNIHKTPERNYLMDPQQVLEVYGEFDANGEDPYAVYHSHVGGPPVLSSGRQDADVENAFDLTLAYVVVSVGNEGIEPTARAYRIRQAYIGVREVASIPLMVTSDGMPWVPSLPSLPWCLTPGNRVRIKYLANGKSGHGGPILKEIAQAEVLGSDQAGDDPSDLYVILEPTAKAAPKRLLVERIREVRTLKEGLRAQGLRADLIRANRHIISAVEGDDLSGVQDLVNVLSAAFPPWINAV